MVTESRWGFWGERKARPAAAIVPTLKRGGLLSGHDIDNTEHAWSANYDGVRQAVEQTASTLGVAFEIDVDYTWFMRIP